jgi:hypothetical protein
MRTRESLRARVARMDIVDGLTPGWESDPPAQRLAWAQAYDNGDGPLYWYLPGYDTDFDDVIEWVPRTMGMSRDYLPDRQIWLRWKTAGAGVKRELKGSGIHDGAFNERMFCYDIED